jgi:hypothetical protein
MARNVVIKITLGVVVALFTSMAMNARDLGQWDDPANADLKRWYQQLKQPDNPAVLCCGETTLIGADAFETTADGEYIVIITDRPKRRAVVSTAILARELSFRKTRSNGMRATLWVMNLIFLSRTDNVFCYLPPLGS